MSKKFVTFNNFKNPLLNNIKINSFGGGYNLILNDFSDPENILLLEEIRKLKWKAYSNGIIQIENNFSTEIKVQKNKLFGKSLINGITLTPYANPVKCPAHCHYCSEDLIKINQNSANSSTKNLIRNYKEYFIKFETLLKKLEESQVKVGLSMSGLEATAEHSWLQNMVRLLDKYKVFEERVLYSNGAGLVSSPESVKSFDRVEFHRDHYEEVINQMIMRIERDYKISKNEVLESTVEKLKLYLDNIFSVSILSKMGVNSLKEAQEYVRWAKRVGFKGVIFRELSRLPVGEYKEDNRPSKWIQENRVSIDILIKNASDQSKILPKSITIGFYYYSETYTMKNFLFEEENNNHGSSNEDFDVILEASCYDNLNKTIECNRNLIHKLVFHSNGNLTTGWDRSQDIIYSF